MVERLRRAAHAGDINELYNFIKEDGRVLKGIGVISRKLNQDVYSPLHLAMQNDHIETTLRLLQVDKETVGVKGIEGYTALHYVVERENLDLLTRFLKDYP
ncbi:hypothetical protein PTKIN_Ptkin16aG0085400 [Pterospermum kingtungense]